MKFPGSITMTMDQEKNPAVAEISEHHEVGDEAPDFRQEAPTGGRFWCILASLCVTSLLSSLESSVLMVSLPMVIEDLQMGDDYVWVINVYTLSCAAVQPFLGQLADIFGRRWLAISTVAIYLIGCTVCGGANSGAMMIVGRMIQGIGGGGVIMIDHIIVSDLVPLRRRGKYMTIILCCFAIGISLGPLIGGLIVQRTTWRWVFYLNLPVAGVAMVVLYLFLHVQRGNPGLTLMAKIKQMDVGGCVILVLANVATLFALAYGGSSYPWSSGRVLVPLIIGFAGLIIFLWYETSRWCTHPMMPLRIFANQTSVVLFLATFLNSMLFFWVMYFLPIYFQSVRQSSPIGTGIQLLPFALCVVPGAMIASQALLRVGKYKLLHHCSFFLTTLGLGLFTRLNSNSSPVEWTLYQILTSTGIAIFWISGLPAFQANCQENDQAAATASLSFIRSIGNVWGVAVPAAIFNNQVARHAKRIPDPTVWAALSEGNAYKNATKGMLDRLSPESRAAVMAILAHELALIWKVSLAFAGLACVLMLWERDVELRRELDSKFGLEEQKPLD